MFKKIMNILFDEEEVIVEEKTTQEEAYEIPKIKPIAEKKPVAPTPKPAPVQAAPVVKPVPTVTPEPVVVEKVNEDVVSGKIRPIMIDADQPKAKKPAPEKDLHFPKNKSNVPYQPVEIISPIFGGPKKDVKDFEPIKPVQTKSRQPMVNVISPMYGAVESKSSLGVIEPEMLELNVEDMHSNSDFGVEIQASLYDMIEGLEDEE